MPSTGSFEHFAITTAAVCSATYMLVFFWLTEEGLRLWYHISYYLQTILGYTFSRNPRYEQESTRVENPLEFELPTWERQYREGAEQTENPV